MAPAIPLLIAMFSRKRRATLLTITLTGSLIFNLAFLSTRVEAVADNSSTFWFHDDTNPLTYMMYQSQLSGSSTNTEEDVTFYSDTFEASQSLESGTAMVYIYATNRANVDKVITLVLGVDGTQLGSGTITVPPQTYDPTLLSTSFATTSYDFADGERLSLTVSSIGAVRVYWDGDYDDSRLVTATIVPEGVLGLLLLAPFIPLFMMLIKRSRGIRSREKRRAGC